MPKAYLWCLDSIGQPSYLCTWDNHWTKLDSVKGKVKQFKKIASSQWCVWAIGYDDEVYLYILKSDASIRIVETVYESERKQGKIFNNSNLKSDDPPNFSYRDAYGKIVVTTLSSYALPSTRWSWEDEWQVRRSYFGHITDEEGWVYGNQFDHITKHDERNSAPNTTNKVNSSRDSNGKVHQQQNIRNYSYSNSQVRQRQWQRYRYFSAINRWILIGRPELSFVISCGGADVYSGSSPDDSSIEDDEQHNFGIIDLKCGGELLPHQKDGHVSVWAVNIQGQILYRLNVHRFNPEGEYWCVVSLPPKVKGYRVSVGPLGHVLVLDRNRDLYFRENITWKNYIGSNWTKFSDSFPLELGEFLTECEVGVYNIWALSNRGRLWGRGDTNLHFEKRGSLWNIIYDGTVPVVCISVSISGQLWSVTSGSNAVRYQLSTDAFKLKQHNVWSGTLNIGFDGFCHSGTVEIVQLSASGLFIENDCLPESWTYSFKLSRTDYIDDDRSWKRKVTDRLMERDYREYKNPKFSQFTSFREQVSWSKSCVCESCIGPNGSSQTYRWVTSIVTIHHKVLQSICNGNGLTEITNGLHGHNPDNATLHINSQRKVSWQKEMIPFIRCCDIVCISKEMLPNHQMQSNICCSLIIVLQDNPHYKPYSFRNTEKVPQVHLNFNSETEVEDWILALNMAIARSRSIRQLNHGNCCDMERIWFLNKFNEPFSAHCSRKSERFYQHGGHFKMIESGDRGLVVWALGFDGSVWVKTKGYGGGYLSQMCSSKLAGDLNIITDTNYITVMEYEKLNLLPGVTFGTFTPHMWLDEGGVMVRHKDKVGLPTQRWQWLSEWTVDFSVGECDVDGWQYSTSTTTKFDGILNWNKQFRRRVWKRQYSTQCVGPWRKVTQDMAATIIDISITPRRSMCSTVGNGIGAAGNVSGSGNTSNQQSYSCIVWAVTDDRQLLRRKGVSISRPEGLEWIHVKTIAEVKSISVNRYNQLWIVCHYGHLRRLKSTVSRDVIKIGEKDWDVFKHFKWERKFLMCSSGDHLSVWAVDDRYDLWTMQFDEITGEPSTTWLHVEDKIKHVSCGSFNRVWVVFYNGTVAERIGLDSKHPSGTGWKYQLPYIGSFVTCR